MRDPRASLDHAGRRIRRAKGGFATEAAARRALRKVLTEIDEGTYVPPSSQTVGAYLAAWLGAQRPHVEPNEVVPRFVELRWRSPT